MHTTIFPSTFALSSAPSMHSFAWFAVALAAFASSELISR
uniref:Uncharacterized protein n=1 Tax=Arundo donax TaxID=35708 RepID=A0A0A9AFX5_ARUDO